MTAEELAHLQRRVVDLTAQHGANSLTFQLRLGEASALIALARRALKLESALVFLNDEAGGLMKALLTDRVDDSTGCVTADGLLLFAQSLGWSPTAKGEANE